MPSQIEKLQGYASHLLDDMIILREKHALLEPMWSHKDVVSTFTKGLPFRGFLALRNALALSCIQDVAKIASDRDKRTPSLHNVVTPLGSQALRSRLREQFASWRIPIEEEDKVPEILAALRRIELREEDDRRQRFDSLCGDLDQKWQALNRSAPLSTCITLRDKVTAHTEIKYVADTYKRFDVSGYGVSWNDLGNLIQSLQELVELANMIIRNAAFAWDMLDSQLREASEGFWAQARR